MSSASDNLTTTTNHRRWIIVEVLGILAVFALAAAWPVPDVNESHYLLKARHHWDLGFLRGDFSLESPEAHRVFYTLFGWLTTVMSLENGAWCGRILTWTLLAAGWQQLSSAVIPRRGVSIITAALYVTLTERFHMAGEWVVGGFESKGFAYALIFYGLAQIVRHRWNAGLVLMGAATAMHPLVGGWSLVALAVAWLWQGQSRPALRSILPGLFVAVGLALLGVWPVLDMNRGVNPATVAEANRIYVFERLPHHLTPFRFKLEFVERHALLVCIWLALCAFTPRDPSQRVIRGFVAGALFITLTGIVISVAFQSYPQLAASLLRFYWFRLGDAILPLGVSLLGTAFILSGDVVKITVRRAAAVAAALLVTWHLGQVAVVRLHPAAPRSDAPNKVIDAADWREACLWLREHTPSDSVLLGPRATQTLKWYSLRREVGNWKDIPQNAKDLVAWWNRMLAIHATRTTDPEEDFWYGSLAEAGTEHTLQAARQFGATHVLTAADPPLALPLVYRNNSYAVYEVTK